MSLEGELLLQVWMYFSKVIYGVLDLLGCKLVAEILSSFKSKFSPPPQSMNYQSPTSSAVVMAQSHYM